MHVTIFSITDAENSIFYILWENTPLKCLLVIYWLNNNHDSHQLVFSLHSLHHLTHIWGNHQTKHDFLTPGQSGAGLFPTPTQFDVGGEVFLSRSSTPTEILYYCRIKKMWYIFFSLEGPWTKCLFPPWFWASVWYWRTISGKRNSIYQSASFFPLTEFQPWLIKNFLDLIWTHASLRLN